MGTKLARGREKINMLTLSADLEHRVITDRAAVLWQEAEAGAPIRSTSQMAVVNAEAQRVNVIQLHTHRLLPLLQPSGVLKCFEARCWKTLLFDPFFCAFTY